MTKKQITQRISEFQKAVDRKAKMISELGNAAWDPIWEKVKVKEATNTLKDLP